MERRTVLKNIGLSFGTMVLTPSVASLIQSCQSTETAWLPAFFSKEEILLIDKVVSLILPSTPGVPGAKEINLAQFIDGMMDKVAEQDEKENMRLGTEVFVNNLKVIFEVDTIAALTSEQVNQALAQHLKVSLEEQNRKGNLLYNYDQAIKAGGNPPPLEKDLIIYSFLIGLRSVAVFGFKNNELIAKEHMVYSPVPGQQQGCVDLQEATQGKAWAL